VDVLFAGAAASIGTGVYNIITGPATATVNMPGIPGMYTQALSGLAPGATPNYPVTPPGIPEMYLGQSSSLQIQGLTVGTMGVQGGQGYHTTPGVPGTPGTATSQTSQTSPSHTVSGTHPSGYQFGSWQAGQFVPVGPSYAVGVTGIINGTTGTAVSGTAATVGTPPSSSSIPFPGTSWWNQGTGPDSTQGIPAPYPNTYQFPGYTSTGQIGQSPLGGIPAPYPNTYPVPGSASTGHTGQSHQGCPSYASRGMPNAFMSAQMVGGYGTFFGGLRSAFC